MFFSETAQSRGVPRRFSRLCEEDETLRCCIDLTVKHGLYDVDNLSENEEIVCSHAIISTP
jgi:hypothetical protein